MPLTDLPIDDLRQRHRTLSRPEDLDAFWTATLEMSRRRSRSPDRLAVNSGLRAVETFDVTFSGFAGEPIKAWLHLPIDRKEALPIVVEYFGYGGGRGMPHEVGIWPLAGFASLQVDTRGQGSGFRIGHTSDPHGHAPSVAGYLTRGISDPADYYYRRVFADAVLAVDAAASFPEVDPERIAVTGHSQGGGIALAAASLSSRVRNTMADVPFLCDFPRGMELVGEFGYGELVKYLSAHRDAGRRVFETLSYFDASVLVESASAAALFSVALMDDVCPPSTVFAAFNAYAGPKEIEVYSYNAHEGGGASHHVKQLDWLRQQLAID